MIVVSHLHTQISWMVSHGIFSHKSRLWNGQIAKLRKKYIPEYFYIHTSVFILYVLKLNILI